jgi:hypothetical protein
VLRHVRAAPRAHLASIVAFGLIVLLAIRYRVLPAMQLDIPYMQQKLDLALQWRKLWVSYDGTFSAAFAHDWLLAQAEPFPHWPVWLLAAQAAAFALLAALRPWRLEPERWRLLVFLASRSRSCCCRCC